MSSHNSDYYYFHAIAAARDSRKMMNWKDDLRPAPDPALALDRTDRHYYDGCTSFVISIKHDREQVQRGSRMRRGWSGEERR